MRKSDRIDAIRLIERILGELNEGRLTADTPTERRLSRRLEGALSALQALDRPSKGQRNGA